MIGALAGLLLGPKKHFVSDEWLAALLRNVFCLIQFCERKVCVDCKLEALLL